jgi:trans-aconitate methyltransferase
MSNPTTWNAAVYQRVSEPQFAWGRKVLERLDVRGDEVALDVGCGTGRLTAELLERLPRGRAVGLDQSADMVAEAGRRLGPRFGDRVEFRHADVLTLADDAAYDLVFSTATFHWVLDHDRLFAVLARALRPGGRLVAQCGGAGNLARIQGRMRALVESPAYAEWFAGWRTPTYYAGVAETEARLRAAGLTDVRAWLEPAPTPFPDAASFAEFVGHVVGAQYLRRLPAEPARAFLAALVEAAGGDDPPFTLDYVRLNIEARRP